MYVHVPFCAGACDYCDFYSVPVKPDDQRMAAYVDRIIEDSKVLLDEFDVKQIPTVYIGGGTPSVLGAELLVRLLEGFRVTAPKTARDALLLSSVYHPGEITLEANPESADRDFLAAVKNAGVTRLSLGIQTFNRASRRAVHRTGEESHLAECLKAAADIFPGAFSVDLISGLPFQDKKNLITDIEKILSYNPAHVSLYALTVDPETPLGINAAKGQVPLPGNDEADELWIHGRDTLEKSGLLQYEVSNFCVPGSESRHNLRYWRMENWLGLGPAASGTLINDESGTGRRFINSPNLNRWLERKPGLAPPGTEEHLDRITLIKEHLLMGFRLTAGPDIALFQKRFGQNIPELIPRTIRKWRGSGLFQKDRVSLTGQGLLLLDSFLIDAFEEIDKTTGP